MSGDREDLIKQLAASYGMPVNVKDATTHYDPGTGTLYCEGVAIPKHTLDRAYKHFDSQKERLKALADRDAVIMDQYLFNVVACNAIKLLHETVQRDIQ